MKRRSFLQLAAGSMLFAPFSGCRLSTRKGVRPQKLLVLGGTNFLGPAVVENALGRGHEVTLFNRGITRPHLFPELEKLRGERAIVGGDLAALAGARRWDAVIDVWPAESKLVDVTARLLADRVEYYYFVSSIAVYTDFSLPGLSEEAAVHRSDPGWYGGEKALAEEAVRGYFDRRSGIARCHAIVGPRDDGASLHYWLRRLARSPVVLAPGSGLDPVQLIDVRDVAAWIIDSVEARRDGIFNLAGPREALTFRDFLERLRAGIESNAELVWVDADFLRARKVRSFDHMPLWAPLDEDEGFQQIGVEKALREGLSFLPLEITARDAWRWYQSHFFRDIEFPIGSIGLSRSDEEAVLAAWSKRD